jgi:hypothetical protein
MPSKKQSEILYWRENKSFEIRKAANAKSPTAPNVQIPPPNESAKDRLIRTKIKDINRMICMVKSKYSKSYMPSVLDSTTLQNTTLENTMSVLKDKRNSKLKKKKSHVQELVFHSYKPIVNPSMNENPLRKRFNNQYERAYRQVISNFSRL